MTELNRDEKFSGATTENADDLLTVLQQVKKNIMKSTNVASIAKVKQVDTTHKIATVQLYPLLEKELEKNIECYYLSNLVLDVSDIVLVLFCDRNFIAALKKLLAKQKPSALNENIDLHSDRYGIIIGILNDKEEKEDK